MALADHTVEVLDGLITAGLISMYVEVDDDLPYDDDD